MISVGKLYVTSFDICLKYPKTISLNYQKTSKMLRSNKFMVSAPADSYPGNGAVFSVP